MARSLLEGRHGPTPARPGVGSAHGDQRDSLSRFGRAVDGSSRSDRTALAIALAGVAISVRVGDPTVALGAVIVADLVAIGLTVHKVRIDPTSEAGALWAIDTVAGVLAIIAVGGPMGVDLAYPIHHTVVSFAVLLTVTRSRSQLVPNPTGYRQAA